ncbi:MAG: fibrobacter succinogenes major paralogous domain-containing protein, partial [Anaerolineales bacterium]|nr:fibrobacter succinogenes major paralogous domain-containing protein [Anaerolineales bacterium]
MTSAPTVSIDVLTDADVDIVDANMTAWSCGSTILYEGKTYNTVLIGSQCWFQENLDYDNGCTSIGWSSSDVGACSYYTGGPYTDEGLLYQWSAAMNGSTEPGTQGLCPVGWHIPEDTELKTLVESQATPGCEASTGYQCDPAGAKLAGNAALWDDGVLDGHTNFGESGFDVLPAGSRNANGTFYNRGSYTYFWSSLQSGASAWIRGLHSDYSTVSRDSYHKANGFSVRCLKDSLTATWTYSWDVPADHSGDTATVSVDGYDIAGNAYAGSDEIIYTIDNTAPTVALTYSANPAKSGSMTITATYSEAIVGTPALSLDQQGTTDIIADNMTDSGDQIIWTYDYTVVTDNGDTYEDGVATVSLNTVTDDAGNDTEAPTGTTFTIDTTAPTVE